MKPTNNEADANPDRPGEYFPIHMRPSESHPGRRRGTVARTSTRGLLRPRPVPRTARRPVVTGVVPEGTGRRGASASPAGARARAGPRVGRRPRPAGAARRGSSGAPVLPLLPRQSRVRRVPERARLARRRGPFLLLLPLPFLLGALPSVAPLLLLNSHRLEVRHALVREVSGGRVVGPPVSVGRAVLAVPLPQRPLQGLRHLRQVPLDPVAHLLLPHQLLARAPSREPSRIALEELELRPLLEDRLPPRYQVEDRPHLPEAGAEPFGVLLVLDEHGARDVVAGESVVPRGELGPLDGARAGLGPQPLDVAPLLLD
mmetsp:Transcript_33926/g.77561  ORF Transcript_33926/g.77561 Transcript_33926/m.77561 type:complete len:316 (-) Transcript_33926:359-1306(-)